MAVRRPLIIDGGSIKELPSGDSLPAPAKTAATLTHTDGAITLDVQAADVFAFTAQEASHTFEFTNVPEVARFLLRLTGAEIGTPYAISAASYDSVSFSVSGQDTQSRGPAFSPDGTKMFIMGNLNRRIYQYSLSTGFDLSTASYDSVSFSVSAQDTSLYAPAFSSDGTKMFVVGNANNAIYQYSLSTGFDLSTASYDSVAFSVNSQDATPVGVKFNLDGTKMFLSGRSSSTIYQYSLSTGFDLSTASYDSVSMSFSSYDASIGGAVTFNSDGTKMFVPGYISDSIYQFSLSTGFDLSTASYDSVSFSVSAQDGSPTGLSFSDDGAKMFVHGDANDTIYQFSTLGSASDATFAYPEAVMWPGGTPPTAPGDGETDILEFMTDDGGTNWYGHLKMDAVA